VQGSILVPGHSFGADKLRNEATPQALDRLAEKRIRVSGYWGQNQRRIDYQVSNVNMGSAL
jgi:hypothetical protein